ncbi:hypothetical protein KC343_g7111 [Hortaea werneckii]|nr:hypothetical protein KC338_g684 [Hortaea werneckii]KAI7359056.1 hypothetical protein KC320_g695 [Hortaea werneckii]KAI7559869.1 hypothetical protein KC317_g10087 [Hortaea werneckii]KAI7610622.1 hypothetical protein KC346_g8651 [Hortaea werneckii]KAI7624047.1 hypothetical protein KC343_g7111 [Hortaea werneckii]
MAKRLREDSVSSSEDAAPAAALSRSPSVEATSHPQKYASLEPTDRPVSIMQCHLPPHKALSFHGYDEYETHYQQAHTNRCTDCKGNFPSTHLLELHITENHDPIIAARREKGDRTFGCFVESCDKVCSDWKKRRSHLIDKHGFPRNYDFFVVNSGIEGRRSMLRPGVDAQGHRKSSRDRSRRDSSGTEKTESTEATSVSDPDGKLIESRTSNATKSPSPSAAPTSDQQGDTSSLDVLTQSMSSLKMVPRSITFGKRSRAGLAKS